MHPSNIKHIQLKTLPLFLGLTQSELDDISDDISFTLQRLKVDEPIVKSGDMCDSINILVSGQMNIVSKSDDHSYSMHEKIRAPWIIEPDKLFGLRQRYQSSYITQTKCEILTIEKSDVTSMMRQYLVVHLNFLNIVCRSAQMAESLPWQQKSADVRGRIVQFIRQHSRYPAGEKTLRIMMRQLAYELNASRLDVSKALNQMEQEEKIILKRGMIVIPAPELL